MVAGKGGGSPIITLTSDFGTADPYAGVLKGVIYSICPAARVVDLSHRVGRYNITHGAFVVRQVWEFFPAGSIHVVVVDPGVGSQRRIIIGRYGGSIIVAPDNGLVTFIHGDFALESMIFAENERYFLPQVSTTFHGRDIMAPIAAHLARGIPAEEMGRPTRSPVLLPISVRAASVHGKLVGRALFADHFGNIITNLTRDQMADCGNHVLAASILVNGRHRIPLVRTYCEVGPGDPLALIGSGGMLEIACNRASAADRFGPVSGVVVELEPPPG